VGGLAQAIKAGSLRRSRPRRVSAHHGLVKDADAWVKAIVLARQGPRCLKCGSEKPLHAAHILSKGGHPGVRFELDNVIGLCMKDHIFWAHRDPVAFVDWINGLFPGRIERLKLASAQYRKIDMKELICVLKAIYKQLLGENRESRNDQQRCFGTGD
jgi:hypothetical protein